MCCLCTHSKGSEHQFYRAHVGIHWCLVHIIWRNGKPPSHGSGLRFLRQPTAVRMNSIRRMYRFPGPRPRPDRSMTMSSRIHSMLSSFRCLWRQQPDEELADIAKEDKNLMDIMVYGEESAKGGRRGSFVNASRHRSSHSLSSHADSLSLSPGPRGRGDEPRERRAEPETLPDASSRKPSKLTSQMTTSPSSNGSSLQTLEEKRECPYDSSTAASRERPFFPYTRRSSQIRPILSSIEASNRAASEDRSGTRVSLDTISGARVSLAE